MCARARATDGRSLDEASAGDRQSRRRDVARCDRGLRSAVKRAVLDWFGVWLRPEPVFVGLDRERGRGVPAESARLMSTLLIEGRPPAGGPRGRRRQQERGAAAAGRVSAHRGGMRPDQRAAHRRRRGDGAAAARSRRRSRRHRHDDAADSDAANQHRRTRSSAGRPAARIGAAARAAARAHGPRAHRAARR